MKASDIEKGHVSEAWERSDILYGEYREELKVTPRIGDISVSGRGLENMAFSMWRSLSKEVRSRIENSKEAELALERLESDLKKLWETKKAERETELEEIAKVFKALVAAKLTQYASENEEIMSSAVEDFRRSLG